MSAIRGMDRRAARNVHSSPYAAARRTAPKPKKSSSWTFGISGILNYINPLRLRRSADQLAEEASEGEQNDEDEDSDSNQSNDAIMQSPNDFSPPVNLVNAQNPAASLAARGRQLANGLSDPPSPNNLHSPGMMFSTPPRPGPNSLDDTNLSPAESLDKVQKFLREKNGQALSEWETRGLLTFIEKSVHNEDEDKPEPFRFSASPSRTPGRGNSPVFVFGATATAPKTPDGDSANPRKTLSKNPNGVYRWQGGGSAKPRNRYQSPSFPSRQSAPMIKLTPAKTEGKRRRVADEPEPPAPISVPFPAVSPQKPTADSSAEFLLTPAPSQSRASIFPSANGTSANGSSGSSSGSGSKANGSASAPRLRTSGLPTKPTAPPIPSPLRQAWGQNDSPPQTPKPNAPTPTKAANFMAELIKEVTPAKKPDLSNPYQTASPVRPPARKTVVKKPRAPKPPAPPPPVPELEKRPEPSPQAIIEATLPKGSKRSRPPADLAKSARREPSPTGSLLPAPGLRSSRLPLALPTVKGDSASNAPMVVEEPADDQEGEQATRKRRKTPVKESTITVEEIEDVDMPTSNSSSLFSRPTEIIEPEHGGSNPVKSSISSLPTSPTKSSSLFGLKSSAPKEPSKLRFSYQADKAEPPLSPLTFSPAGPAPSSTSQPAAPRPAAATLPGAALSGSSNAATMDPKQTVLVMALHDLPTYTFPSIFQPILPPQAARDEARTAPSASLPAYDFNAPLPSKTAVPLVDKPVAPPVVAFDWSGAGMKGPSTVGASWTCSTCMLSNPASATDKCTICDSKR
ncbi:hypothetical protein HWV62_4701 [Athelia sp. TMB]|nr:hypothetical protein HWV62_4701 [Athelia sp. TMB]